MNTLARLVLLGLLASLYFGCAQLPRPLTAQDIGTIIEEPTP